LIEHLVWINVLQYYVYKSKQVLNVDMITYFYSFDNNDTIKKSSVLSNIVVGKYELSKFIEVQQSEFCNQIEIEAHIII